MLSHKLRQMLEHHVSFWRFNMGYGKLLLPPIDRKYKQTSEWLTLLTIPWMCFCGVFPYFLIPITTTFFCARMAWHVALALARLHELGRHDLVSITRIGFWNLTLLIGRNYAQPAFSSGHWLYIIGIVISVFAFFLIAILSRSLNTFLTLTAVEVTLALTVYFDFHQALSLSFLISIASSHLKERSGATVATLFGFVSIQLLCYLLWFISFYVMFNVFYVALADSGVYLAVAIGVATGILLLTRELVIYGIWCWLKQRVNDDITLAIEGSTHAQS